MSDLFQLLLHMHIPHEMCYFSTNSLEQIYVLCQYPQLGRCLPDTFVYGLSVEPGWLSSVSELFVTHKHWHHQPLRIFLRDVLDLYSDVRHQNHSRVCGDCTDDSFSHAHNP